MFLYLRICGKFITWKFLYKLGGIKWLSLVYLVEIMKGL